VVGGGGGGVGNVGFGVGGCFGVLWGVAEVGFVLRVFVWGGGRVGFFFGLLVAILGGCVGGWVGGGGEVRGFSVCVGARGVECCGGWFGGFVFLGWGGEVVCERGGGWLGFVGGCRGQEGGVSCGWRGWGWVGLQFVVVLVVVEGVGLWWWGWGELGGRGSLGG